MGFMDKLESAAGATASKAKEVAAVARLNSSIADEEKTIAATYTDIGKFIYETQKDNTESPVYSLCQKIAKAEKEIERLKAEIEEIKG